MYENLAILAAFVFLYSIASGGLEKTLFSGAVVFTAFGFAFGPLGLGVLDLNIEEEGLRTLAELTLALVLFIDAAGANLGVLKKNIRIPRNLLLIGLPLTILLGFGAGTVLFGDLSVFEIAIIAILLAPTDAALGKAVVTDESVPSNIREGLNVESGLNDGICVPILFVLLALAAGNSGEDGAMALALTLVAEEIGIGLAVGLGLAWVGHSLIRRFNEHGWVSESWVQLTVSALAIACFSLAQSIGGSGFIASFAGGLLFGALVRKHKHELLLAAEGTSDIFSLITWIVFGAVVVGRTIDQFAWQPLLYAILSLTVIRMLPVYLSLIGTGLRSGEKLFVGWFGPRGLASIVFAVIVINENLPGGDTITLTAVYTILLSVIAHGISAHPFVAALMAGKSRSNSDD